MIRIYSTIETILICNQCNNARAMFLKYNLIKINQKFKTQQFCLFISFSLVRGSFYFTYQALWFQLCASPGASLSGEWPLSVLTAKHHGQWNSIFCGWPLQQTGPAGAEEEGGVEKGNEKGEKREKRDLREENQIQNMISKYHLDIFLASLRISIPGLHGAGYSNFSLGLTISV